MPTRLAPVLFVFLVWNAAAAQTPTSPDTIVPWVSLTERPRLRDSPPYASIEFPPILRNANVVGEVRLRVDIGPDGVPRLESLRVESTTHSIFTSAVVLAMRQWKLTAPTLDARAVRTTMPVDASFTLVDDRNAPTRDINIVATDSVGLHIRIGQEPVSQTPGLTDDATDRRAALIAILSNLTGEIGRSSTVASCVGREDSTDAKLPNDVFQVLHEAHPTLLNADRCPPTYTSMILQLDASGKPLVRPKGAVDPVWITARQPHIWTTDLYVARARITQGTGFTEFFCSARRASSQSSWTGRCVRGAQGVY